MPPKEVNNPIGQKIVDCVSLSIGNWFTFLKLLEFNSFGNVCSKKEEAGQGKSLHVLFLWRHSTLWKCARGREGMSDNHQTWAYILYGWFLSKVLYMGISLGSPLKFGIFDISYTIFDKKFNIFSINSILQDYFITVGTIIWLCSYIKEIYDLHLKT